MFEDYTTYRDTQEPRNKIVYTSHHATIGAGGDKKAAATINTVRALTRHLEKIYQAAEHMPNLIGIDFYEYPNNESIKAITDFNKKIFTQEQAMDKQKSQANDIPVAA